MTDIPRESPSTAPDEAALSELARALPDKPEDAGSTLPTEARESYKEARRSVVDARRHAETREGLLRVC